MSLALGFLRFVRYFGLLVDETKMNFGSKTTFIGLDTDKRKFPLSKRFVMYAYDKDTGEIFGRTPSSWGKSSIFFAFMLMLIKYVMCLNTFEGVSIILDGSNVPSSYNMFGSNKQLKSWYKVMMI